MTKYEAEEGYHYQLCWEEFDYEMLYPNNNLHYQEY